MFGVVEDHAQSKMNQIYLTIQEVNKFVKNCKKLMELPEETRLEAVLIKVMRNLEKHSQ